MIKVERVFDPKGIAKIDSRLGLGDIQIASGNGDQIHLGARIHSNREEELETQIVGDTLTIQQNVVDIGRNRRIDVTLTLPTGIDADLSLHTGKGDLKVSQVSGAHNLASGKGDISVSGGRGLLTVGTGYGDIAVSEQRGAAVLETGKGDVTVSALAGTLKINSGAGDATIRNWNSGDASNGKTARKNSVNLGAGDVGVRYANARELAINTAKGDCRLHSVRIANLQITTSKGDIAVDGEPASGEWRATTVKGDISMRMPAQVGVRVEAATRRGKIDSDLPQVRVGRPGPASRFGGGRTIGVVGDEPRADIQLETVMGDIVVRTVGAIPVAIEEPSARSESVLAPLQPEVVDPGQKPVAALPPTQPVQTRSENTAMEILESLSNGEITVEEAESLLRIVD